VHYPPTIYFGLFPQPLLQQKPLRSQYYFRSYRACALIQYIYHHLRQTLWGNRGVLVIFWRE